MLDTILYLNSWIWGIIGLVIGVPIVFMIGVSTLISIIGGCFALFNIGGKK